MKIRRKSRTWSAVLAILVGVAVPAASSAAEARDYTPGAPGVGDPYFPQMGNGGYDAVHYDLGIGYVPRTGQLTGNAVIHARATQNLSQFNLDFQGLDVERVAVNGHTASYSRSGQELTVWPQHGLPKGTRFTVRVAYSGVPEAIDDPALGVSGFSRTRDGAVALSSPIGSATWYPVNDHPTDKATYDFRLTVPAGLSALANGDLADIRAGHRTSTFRWSATDPMASYLTTIAIGRFDVRTGRTPHGIRQVTAVDPDLEQNCADAEQARRSALRGVHRTVDRVTDFHATTAAVTDWAARTFGRYPFSSTGGIVDDAMVGYALETQTRPVYDCEMPSTDLIVHEIAHQWYGNSVSPMQWKDIWLSEGLATYAEWLYTEHHGGPTAQQQFQAAYDSYPGGDPFWQVIVDNPGRDELFAPAVYERGAMALEMLRQAIGDPAFRQLLRTWAAKFHDGNATTAQFVALAEKTSGKDLDHLFEVWVSTPGKPRLDWGASRPPEVTRPRAGWMPPG